jgi:hypothetical protein
MAGSFFYALFGSGFGRVLRLQANEEGLTVICLFDGAHHSKWIEAMGHCGCHKLTHSLKSSHKDFDTTPLFSATAAIQTVSKTP